MYIFRLEKSLGIAEVGLIIAKGSRIFGLIFRFFPIVSLFFGLSDRFSSLCRCAVGVPGHLTSIAPFTEHLIGTLGI
jgi:hypothetical protein